MAVRYRDASAADLPAIVRLLADDPLGAEREAATLPLDPGYAAAFEAIVAAPNQRLIVAVDGDRVIGTLQLAFLPGLSNRGATHGQIEAVRIATDRRGTGEGGHLVDWAIAACRQAGCGSVQLVSHESRSDAHRFWQRLGFVRSHAGFKLTLG